MKIECKDLEHALRQQEPGLLEAMAAHAETCSACREQLSLWNEISAAARDMRKSWDSPDLWPKIRQALAAEWQGLAVESQAARSGWAWIPRTLFHPLAVNWQAVAAVLTLLFISASSTWLLLRDSKPRPAVEKRLLTEQALRDIESTEAAYLRSIEKLAALVEPRVQHASSPLLVSYREKLMLIDSAIAECRASVDQNRFNAHLRKELLSTYQEKQRTLQELIRDENHEAR